MTFDPDAECPHFARPLLFDGECTICKPPPKPTTSYWDQFNMVAIKDAAFDSRCPQCGRDISKGDTIGLISYAGDVKAVCADCAGID